MRTLIGGVGHHDLCDHSLGPLLAAMLEGEDWPERVLFEDLSYGAVHVAQRLKELEPSPERMIVIGAVARGRPAGTVTAYEWDRALPDVDDVQARVGEALTGIVGLDNLLVVTAALGAAPPTILVLEVEPQLERLGTDFSPPVAAAVPRIRRLVRDIVDGGAGAPLQRAPLGRLAA